MHSEAYSGNPQKQGAELNFPGQGVLSHPRSAPGPEPVKTSRLNTAQCFKCSDGAGDSVRLECGHTACRNHLKEYLTSESKRKTGIKCPHSGCVYVCPTHVLMLILEKVDFREYCRNFLKSIMVQCPQEDCRVIEQIGSKHRIVECSNCRTAYCSRCEALKAECRCEAPKELVCRTCYTIMRPDRHKLMSCENCRNSMCTYCSLDELHCTCSHTALNAISRIDSVQICGICGLDISDVQNLFAMEDCTHIYHKECIADFVNCSLESGNFSSLFGCLNKGCKGSLGNFQHLVSADKWALHQRKLIERVSKFVDCPNVQCRQEFAVDKEAKSAACPACRLQFCLSCQQPQHEGNCPQEIILEKVRLVECTGEKISQCPGCKLPYIKDEHSDHVKCMNPHCKVEFYCCCSCLRLPSIKHCNAWHRPNCRWYYGVGVDTEKFRKDCPECIRLGRRCDPPKELRVPCRFDEDEA